MLIGHQTAEQKVGRFEMKYIPLCRSQFLNYVVFNIFLQNFFTCSCKLLSVKVEVIFLKVRTCLLKEERLVSQPFPYLPGNIYVY